MGKIPGALARIIDGLSWLGGEFAGASIFLMMLIITYSVSARYTLGRPVVGAEEVSGLLLVVCVFLSAAYTLRQGGHIVVDTVVARLPQRWQDWLRLVTYLMGLLYTGVLAWQGWELFWSNYLLGRKTPTLLIPFFIPQVTIVLGLWLLFLALLVAFLRHVRRLARGQ